MPCAPFFGKLRPDRDGSNRCPPRCPAPHECPTGLSQDQCLHLPDKFFINLLSACSQDRSGHFWVLCQARTSRTGHKSQTTSFAVSARVSCPHLAGLLLAALNCLRILASCQGTFRRPTGALLNRTAVEAWPTYGPPYSNVGCPAS